jgi:hypothetical protein
MNGLKPGSPAMRVLFALIPALALAACAGHGGVQNSYSAELAQLESDCNARGGMLLPLPPGGTSRPATDFYCDIRGPGERFRTPLGADAAKTPG